MNSEFLPLVDFSKVKKKKKGKIIKKTNQEEDELDDTLIAKKKDVEIKIPKGKEGQISFDSQENKHYDMLLKRIYELLKAQNSNPSEALKLPPIKVSVGNNKRSAWVNAKEICDLINRDIDQVMDYVKREVGVNCSKGEEGQLKFVSSVPANKLEGVLIRYINQFVKCPNCKSKKTKIIRDTQARLDKIYCSSCKSERTIQIKKKK